LIKFLEGIMEITSLSRATRVALACALALLTVLVIAGPVAAQTESTPKWDLFIGYQWLHPNITTPAAYSDPNNPTPFLVPDMAKGIGGALTYNVDPHWGLELDLGHSTKASNYDSTISAGPRFMWRNEGVNFFLHGLASYNRLAVQDVPNRSNGVGVLLGGGMDISFTKMFAIRLFQADYVWAHHHFPDLAGPQFPDLRRPAMEGVRLRTGVVFNFGGAEAPAPIAACSVQPTEVERQWRQDNWERHHGQYRHQRCRAGRLYDHGACNRSQGQEGERGELFGKLHHQTASAEESADNESLGKSDRTDAGRSSECFRQLLKPRRSTGHSSQLDFHSRDAFR
jgi:hypothetical protein